LDDIIPSLSRGRTREKSDRLAKLGCDTNSFVGLSFFDADQKVTILKSNFHCQHASFTKDARKPSPPNCDEYVVETEYCNQKLPSVHPQEGLNIRTIVVQCYTANPTNKVCIRTLPLKSKMPTLEGEPLRRLTKVALRASGSTSQ
jgi:hypothetical protein